eukprot:CAMPEP_0119479746 /NCGR_PEP_ID=MMETSP1344-20130328/8875_1 /TAXON_ID=236787 /ORGANISM="Florenciella parvula, Strain CCMP2471" /LENGTH=95 /DNA_ID=CAMNT_0007514003 /DNA_START=11 /DNA_END=295 /DNA_ORIENTATION=-
MSGRGNGKAKVGRVRVRPVCATPECTSLAKGDGSGGAPEFCAKHGGGRKCANPGCTTLAKGDGSGGVPEFCAKHGGGRRCAKPECTSLAKGDGSG